MDIYAVLKSDHKQVKSILKQLDQTTERSIAKRVSLMKQLKEALVPHVRAEEKIFYDRLKESEVKEAEDLAFEGYEEHGVVDRILEEIESTEPNDKRWTALLSVAKETIEHHIEEEEKEMFKKAKKTFDRKTSIEMAEEFTELRAEFLKEVKRGKNPKQSPSHEIVKAA